MGPKVSRLLVWSVLFCGCGGAVDNANAGLDTNASDTSEAGSGGRWMPTSAAGTRASGSKAGSGGSATTPSAGSAATTAGRAGGGPTSSAGSAAIGRSPAGGSGGPSSSAGAGGGGTAGGAGSAAGSGGSTVAVPTEKFSFFVTSLEAMRELSGSEEGFGGDLRHGETTGLAGADKICSEIAESSMPGASGKVWRAFLSAKAGGASGGAVHAKDRIGSGPWYDRTGRLIAMDVASLLETRPGGADAAIADNLPNERGEPNRASEDIDNHDIVTGSNERGEYNGGETCADWTTTMTPASTGGMPGGGRGGGGRGPMCGHSWPAQSGQSWIRAHNTPGCAPSVNLVQMGGGMGDGIGNSGGYGGIYCFALSP